MRFLFFVLAGVCCALTYVLAAAPALRLERGTLGTWVIHITGSGEAPVTLAVDSNQAVPALLGTLESDGDDRVFRPRFPLQPGLTYRATIASTPPTILKFSIPAVATTPTTRIAAVYPSADLLPENQLKFYLHFSNSMARGDAYRWIRLLDSQGQSIAVPFLELGEELWDADNKRLTLFFDPGRVKSDLLPGREMGAPLRAGQSYTLEIDAGWPDAHGSPLIAGYRKTFRVGAADRTVPDPKLWRTQAPRAATMEPLTIELPEPLDHALLLRMIEVRDANGQVLPGNVAVDRNETRWRFTPTTAWRAGEYSLRANTALEDLAGNKLNRPFEFEGTRTPEQRTSAEFVSIPVRISSSPAP